MTREVNGVEVVLSPKSGSDTSGQLSSRRLSSQVSGKHANPSSLENQHISAVSISTVTQQYIGSQHVDEAHDGKARKEKCRRRLLLSEFSNMIKRPLDIVLNDFQKSVPASNDYDGLRKSLKSQIVKSLRKDRKLWWISKAQEVEKAFATLKACGL
ncbi:hypothetical protein CLF_110330 [Clonorchis sinensis]|uniref:ATP-binding cassette transporter n=1 Tax=Clonorchis sinensis TaxID=79923 RepID=G7YTE9_CLOSI|nr:hypothetical protein CLF_110330 [Clonorchis sinensis]